MCSLKLPETLFGADATETVYAAVTDVAERSFFCMIDPCEAERFGDLAAIHDGWLSSTVHFDDGKCSGSVTCRLPMALASRLFDAFSGRDAEEPQPEERETLDLVGEFANMVCGSWLTRAVNQRTFALSPPAVVPIETAGVVAGVNALGLLVVIDDLPCAVDISVTAASAS
jgi:CheY-specific phosphatase CheX